jgi:hypothetical protein
MTPFIDNTVKKKGLLCCLWPLYVKSKKQTFCECDGPGKRRFVSFDLGGHGPERAKSLDYLEGRDKYNSHKNYRIISFSALKQQVISICLQKQ